MRSTFILVRSLLLIVNTFSLFDYIENRKLQKLEDEYSNCKFLLFTKISQSLAITTAVLGIIHRNTGEAKYARNFLIPISFSFEFIVTTIYWCMYFIDKKLIIDNRSVVSGFETPMVSRICSHLLPLILAYLEKMDFKIKPSKYHLLFVVIFEIVYCGLVVSYGIYFGRYVYPFLDKMAIFHKILFFAGVTVIGMIGYVLAFVL